MKGNVEHFYKTVALLLLLFFIYSVAGDHIYKSQIQAAERTAEEVFGTRVRIENNRLYLYEIMTEDCVKTIESKCPTYEQHLLTVVTDTSPENAVNLQVYIKSSASEIMPALKRSKESVKLFYEEKHNFKERER